MSLISFNISGITIDFAIRNDRCFITATHEWRNYGATTDFFPYIDSMDDAPHFLTNAQIYIRSRNESRILIRIISIPHDCVADIAIDCESDVAGDRGIDRIFGGDKLMEKFLNITEWYAYGYEHLSGIVLSRELKYVKFKQFTSFIDDRRARDNEGARFDVSRIGSSSVTLDVLARHGTRELYSDE